MSSNAASEATKKWEAALGRNPHKDFKSVEASRPDYDPSRPGFTYTKSPNPAWTPGSGSSDPSVLSKQKISIDPYEEGRVPGDNYKLLISGVVPRPIGFVSTVTKDGKGENLAPFSYTQIVNHDPPILVVGFSSGQGAFKDTLQNALDTKELTVNIISEWMVEAANYCAINAPSDISEWALTGLTQTPSKVVKAPIVAESAFSIECRLLSSTPFHSKLPPHSQTGTLLVLEGVYFHVREDALNSSKNIVDIKVLKPVSRLGGITYGRVGEGYEMPRPDWGKEVEGGGLEGLVRERVRAQEEEEEEEEAERKEELKN
ncbi:hypothetical protein YB2330_006582 [Saitoella coloradoensis]